MKRIRRWRYYCDYCKKSSGRSLADHEKHCTMNPARVCRFCKLLGETQRPLAELFAAIRSVPREGSVLTALGNVTGKCPACILAAIRQYPDTLFDESVTMFDYKAASKQALDELNAVPEMW